MDYVNEVCNGIMRYLGYEPISNKHEKFRKDVCKLVCTEDASNTEKPFEADYIVSKLEGLVNDQKNLVKDRTNLTKEKEKLEKEVQNLKDSLDLIKSLNATEIEQMKDTHKNDL